MKIIITITLLLMSNPIYSAVELISGGGFEVTISTAQLGKEIELPPLLIYPTDTDRIFTILKIRPSKVEKIKSHTYNDLPLKYLTLRSTNIYAKAGEKAQILMTLKIPNKRKYRKGGDYHILICIKLKPKLGQIISVATYPRLKIRILTADEIKKNHNGDNTFDRHNSTSTLSNKQSQKIK